MVEVRGVVVSANQFGGYNPPVYEVRPGERVLSAELRRESGNQLTLYLTVESLGEARETIERAAEEPLGVDISDYSDEFCAGFLAGQANAIEFISRPREGSRPR